MKKLFQKGLVSLLAVAMVMSSLWAALAVTAAATTGELTNGGFEDGLTGYEVSAKMNAEVVTDVVHGGSKAIKTTASGAWNNAFLTKSVSVASNTEYKWHLWFYSLSNNKPLVGVRTADGTKLLPSTLTSPDGGYVDPATASFAEEREVGNTGNWNQGLTTQSWKEYVVTFSTNEQTTVLLTLNLFYDNRSGYTDDWSLEKANSLPFERVANGDFETTGDEDDPVPGFVFNAGVNCDGTATIVDDATRGSKVLSLNSGTKYTLNTYRIYQTIRVEANTDYVWSLYVNPTAGAQQYLGVVAGNDVSATGNTTLPVSASVLSGSLTLQANAFEWGSVGLANQQDVADPNWLMFGANNGWKKIAVTFNSGDNTVISLAYVARASGRAVLFDDWELKKFTVEVVNGDFENGTAGFTAINNCQIFETVVDPDNAENHLLHFSGNTARGSGNVYQDVAVKANTEYVLSFRMKQTASSTDPLYPLIQNTSWTTLSSRIEDENGILLVKGSGANGSGIRAIDQWKTFRIFFNSGAYTTIRINLNAWASTNEIYLDDLAIAPYSAPIRNMRNGGFEDGLTDYKTTEKFSGEIVTSEAHTGNQSLKVGTAAGGWYNAYVYKEVSVIPNTDYEWSFWFKCDSGATGNVLSAGVLTDKADMLLPSAITSANGGYLLSANASFDTLRTAGNYDNWHKGFTSDSWRKYTVAFNSGDYANITLILDAVYTNRLGYTDDWTLTAAGQSSVLNGDFENGLIGFDTEGGITAETVTDGGSTVAKLVGGTTAFTPMIFQRIPVEPYTEYVWSFDIKTVAGGNAMFGVRNSAGTELLASRMTANTAVTVFNPKFLTTRGTAPANWHQSGSANAYTTYTIRFYTGADSEVLLTINAVNNARTLYTDNWTLAKTEVKHGDANGDSAFTADDIAVEKKMLLGIEESTFSYAGIDVNADGVVTLLDLVALKKSFTNFDLTDQNGDTISLNGYRLVWSDDFNTENINSDKWNFYALMAPRSDLKLYSDERAVETGNGTVTLKADYDEAEEVYTSNLSLTTKNAMAFKYGYVEMRAKLPFGAPAFPSFWMQSTRRATNVMGEVDMLEHFGLNEPTIQTGIHKWHADGSHDVNNGAGKIATYTFANPTVASDWHTYGLLWTETELKFLVDGVVYHTIDITDNFGAGDMECFQDYAYLIMNNYLYTEAGIGDPDDAWKAAVPEDFEDGPIEYVIDYVRLYQTGGNGGLINE